MGMGMGMVRAICPNYIKDVVHPRNGWLETVLPPAMTAAGILLGQVAAVLQLEFSPGVGWPPLLGVALFCTWLVGSSPLASSPPPRKPSPPPEVDIYFKKFTIGDNLPQERQE